MRCAIFCVWLSLCLGVRTLSYSQSNHTRKIQLGVKTSIGTTTKQSPFGYGLGISLQSQYKASDELSVLFSIGYTRLLTKDTSLIPDYDFIPAKAGLKIFPFSIPVFLVSEVGAGFGIINGSKTSFIFGGGGGYDFENGIGVALCYEAYQQSNTSSTFHPLNGQYLVASNFRL